MSPPPGRQAPLIGVTPDVSRQEDPAILVPERYLRAVWDAGGVPAIVPVTVRPPALRRILDRFDGLVVTGGNFDIHPRFYGEQPIKELGEIKEERTEFELALIDLALRSDFPVLGVCAGAQAINVALGGSLYQDIAVQLPRALQHERGAGKRQGGHRVNVRKGSRLERIVRRSVLEVNTTHHQAVKQLGRGLIANATSEDGVIEGIESGGHSFVLGVQWHPEVLCPRDHAQKRLFSALVVASGRMRRKA